MFEDGSAGGIRQTTSNLKPSIPHILMYGGNCHGTGKTLVLDLFLSELATCAIQVSRVESGNSTRVFVSRDDVYMNCNVANFLLHGGEGELLKRVTSFLASPLPPSIRERFLFIDSGIEQLSITTQLILIGLLDKYDTTARFVFVANTDHYEPGFRSKCMEWIWMPPDETDIVSFLKQICKSEGRDVINMDTILPEIATSASGNVQQALCLLQDVLSVVQDSGVPIILQTPEEQSVALFVRDFLIDRKNEEETLLQDCLSRIENIDARRFVDMLGKEIDRHQNALKDHLKLRTLVYDSQCSLEAGRCPALVRDTLLAKIVQSCLLLQQQQQQQHCSKRHCSKQ